MRYRPGGGVFRIRPQRRPTSIQFDPVQWRSSHEMAARRARSMRDLLSETARDSLDTALRRYVGELYRTDVTHLNKPSDPKRRT